MRICKLSHETIGTFVRRLEKLKSDDLVNLGEHVFLQVKYDARTEVDYVSEKEDWNVCIFEEGSSPVSSVLSLLKKFLPTRKDRAVGFIDSKKIFHFIDKSRAETQVHTTHFFNKNPLASWDKCYLKDLKFHESVMADVQAKLATIVDLAGQDADYLYKSVERLAGKYPTVKFYWVSPYCFVDLDDVLQKWPRLNIRFTRNHHRNLLTSVRTADELDALATKPAEPTPTDVTPLELTPTGSTPTEPTPPDATPTEPTPSEAGLVEDPQIYLVDSVMYVGIADVMKMYNLTESQIDRLFKTENGIHKCQVPASVMEAFQRS